jgi:hypothetical protein
LLTHQLLLLLALLKELELGDDASDLALIHNVHLSDVKHYEQEVKLTHRCVLEHDKGRNIFLNVFRDVLVVEINGGIPEILQLLLLSQKFKW